MLKSKILNQVQDLVQHDSLGSGFDLTYAMNHIRFMISPELHVVQETLASGFALFILLSQLSS